MKPFGLLPLITIPFAIHLRLTTGQQTLYGGTSVNAQTSVTAAAGAGAGVTVQGTTVSIRESDTCTVGTLLILREKHHVLVQSP